MPLASGVMLTDHLVLERQGRLSLDETVTIVTQACKAVTRAHAQGIVHRDIKPANLFLMDVDGELFVKVLDFGIAKYLEADEPQHHMTQTGAMVGTPYYRATRRRSPSA